MNFLEPVPEDALSQLPVDVRCSKRSNSLKFNIENCRRIYHLLLALALTPPSPLALAPALPLVELPNEPVTEKFLKRFY